VTGLAIRSIGAITAGGPNAAQALGAMHAQIQLFGDTKVNGPVGEPITGAVTPLGDKIRGVERVAALGTIALAECAAGAPPTLPALPLIVCAPAPADMGATENQLLERLLADAGPAIDRARSRVVARGKDSIDDGITAVAQALLQLRLPGCYLLGVDSLVTPERLKKIANQGGVIDGVETDGFVPGEAAAALLFLPRDDKQTLAVLAGLGGARESAASGTAPTGQAIGSALEGALAEARVSPNRVTAIAHDLSGRYTQFEELALASARPPFANMAGPRTVQVSVTAGETGAAAAALSLAALAFFLREGVVSGSAVSLFTGEGPARGAAVLVRDEARADARIRR
jgi:3-oxoacyl-[acyl-carrier-protein] synthase-1